MLVTGIAGMMRVRGQWSRIRAAVAREDPADDSTKDQSFDDQSIELTREDKFARNDLERLNASGHSEYSAAEGRLYHEGNIYVSEVLRDVIMKRYHDSSLTGHFGAEKTQALIQRKYFWPAC